MKSKFVKIKFNYNLEIIWIKYGTSALDFLIVGTQKLLNDFICD